ncbi:ABC transporter permease [Pseudomonas sp. 7P_10.2_Bac1]|uniref:ABC transporter permease n=1 Tax=Pseudomonas sp. 7P_10.2_Bac1 TaxID=2971614 RepID=UPI0021C9E885|nr:ABC transporter permease [Pseudomonas sp. 7P_10.2_Bac1]MCU1729660.1 ABC transporter permease [Pseudomonas sp. 7P_10.2_Bac1]
MNTFALLMREAWVEVRAGLRSGIPLLVFLGLTGYLLMSLTNADYVQKMGASDIARNAPSLIYLMSCGCMFFLFFAWAWVFAQPALRDRKAQLEEVLLALPLSLPTLLWGRFIGASLVGGLLASSLIVGFLVSPVLGWLGWVPAASIGAPMWSALGFAWVALLLPVSTGIGALYYLLALRSRGLAAPFGLATVLMLLWMFAVVVLKGGDINPLLAASLDPSLFTFAHTQVEIWTAAQKSQSLLALTPGFWLNRVLWCVLPLLLLAVVLARTSRQGLMGRRSGAVLAEPPMLLASSVRLPGPLSANHWPQALWREACWQVRQLFARRIWWIALGLLLVMGVLSGFVHGVWHARGPMVPRADLTLPLLSSALFLVIAFIVAALVGLVCRRDDVEGLGAMLQATPAPAWLRLLGRVACVLMATLALALVPGVASLLISAIAAPDSLAPGFVLIYQALVFAPPLLELAMLTVLVHALIRRSGLAYATSMLLTFFLVLNHELGLVSYPAYEMAIPAHVSLSQLVGWAPWLPYLATLAGWKLAGCLVLLAVAALVLPRGPERRRFADLRRGLLGLPGVLLALGALGLLGSGNLLHRHLVEQGSYQSVAEERAESADWEQRWLAGASAWQVAGGRLQLRVDSTARHVEGQWTLEAVVATHLDAELPPGLQITEVSVLGQPVTFEQATEHLRVPLAECVASGCSVQLNWTVSASGWPSEGEAFWLGPQGVWLEARRVVPRLGLDSERLLRAPVQRSEAGLTPEVPGLPAGAAVAVDAVAPAGAWQWQIEVDGQASSGQTAGPLDFAYHGASTQNFDGVQVLADASRQPTAREVREDLDVMAACVARRLGSSPTVEQLSQWPTGMGGSRLSHGHLLLSQAPDWDVAQAGVGRWARRAHIAELLARRVLIDASDLHRTPGYLGLSQGVAGAIGLLCVDDADGPDARSALVKLQADDLTRALGNDGEPVGTLSDAREQGWAEHYAPLVSLDWVAGQTPEQLSAMTAAIRNGQGWPAAIQDLLGAPSDHAIAAALKRWGPAQ